MTSRKRRAKAKRYKTVQYFGYGPAADPDVIAAIIGRRPLLTRPAILKGYKLGLQSLNDIPNKKIPGLPFTARELMRILWKKDAPSGFKMYVAHKGPGRIRGAVHTIRDSDMGAMRDWELVDFKWYSIVHGKVKFDEGKTGDVITIAVKNQRIGKNIDGLKYKIFPFEGRNFKKIFIKHAKISRLNYLSRLKSGSVSANYKPHEIVKMINRTT